MAQRISDNFVSTANIFLSVINKIIFDFQGSRFGMFFYETGSLLHRFSLAYDQSSFNEKPQYVFKICHKALRQASL